MCRWKTNATDLAMMQKNEVNHSEVMSNLGWQGTKQVQTSPYTSGREASKGLDLENSGRELRSTDVNQSLSTGTVDVLPVPGKTLNYL